MDCPGGGVVVLTWGAMPLLVMVARPRLQPPVQPAPGAERRHGR